MPIKIPWPHPEKPPGKSGVETGNISLGSLIKDSLWLVSSGATVAAVGFLSKFWIKGLNTTSIYNGEVWLGSIENREAGKGLVTVCNHVSTVDDPLLFGLLPPRLLANRELMRWGLGASDVCFTKQSHGTFFALGKIVPVVRGEGVYQKGMNMLLDKLNEGDWVHIFPEGKVNIKQEWMRLKWGVGRLIAEAQIPPLLLPFWHEGLSDVLPLKKPYRPRIGHQVTVVFGDVIDTSLLLESLRKQHLTTEGLRKAVTDFIQSELRNLRDKAREIHYGAQNIKEQQTEKINDMNSNKADKSGCPNQDHD